MTVASTGAKKWLKWFPLNVGTSLILATVLSLVTFMLLLDVESKAADEEALVATPAESVQLVEESLSAPIAEGVILIGTPADD